ncbi:hypothetical protein [Deinococcus kurensis]|uniref:hypothetical protein n=1 Tax=Deinococcus kurensis TaxID=2662757 RepID=UPI0012D31C85|nr:hypothetical protein [Deinococcus kurensis]
MTPPNGQPELATIQAAPPLDTRKLSAVLSAPALLGVLAVRAALGPPAPLNVQVWPLPVLFTVRPGVKVLPVATLLGAPRLRVARLLTASLGDPTILVGDAGRLGESARLVRGRAFAGVDLLVARETRGIRSADDFWADDAAQARERVARGQVRTGADVGTLRDAALRSIRRVREDAGGLQEAERGLDRHLPRADALRAAVVAAVDRAAHRTDRPRGVQETRMLVRGQGRAGLDAAAGRDGQRSTRRTGRADTLASAEAAARHRAAQRTDLSWAAEGVTVQDAAGRTLRVADLHDHADARTARAVTRAAPRQGRDAARGVDARTLHKTIHRADAARSLDGATRRAPVEERSYQVINERTAPYLAAFSGTGASELTLLPATSALDGGELNAVVRGEDLGLTLSAAALSSLPVVTDLADLMLSALEDGVLPAALDRSGARAWVDTEDAEIRAALWGTLGFLNTLRWATLPAGLDDRLRAAALTGVTLANTLTAAGAVRVEGAYLLRETALAGLCLTLAGRVMDDPGMVSAGYRVLNILTGTFRSPRAPYAYAATISAGLASVALDAEGFALSGLLALAFDQDAVADELLLELGRAATTTLAPFALPEAVATLGADFTASLVSAPPAPAYRVRVDGYANGGPTSVNGRATVLGAALEVRAYQHGRAATTLRGLERSRVLYGPFSHALRREAREPDLCLASSVAAEFVYDLRFLV